MTFFGEGQSWENSPKMLCPHIYSTDLSGLICKRLEEAHLAYLRTLLRPAPSLIRRHTPYRAHEVKGPECQLECLKLVILLSPSGVNAGDPPPPGIVDARIRHQQVLGLLDPHGIIIDEDVNGVAPEALIHIHPKVMQPNVAIGAHDAPAVPEPEGALQATRLDRSPLGMAEHHLRRQVEDAPLVIGAFVGPVPPELVVLHERRMLPIDGLPLEGAADVRIEHPALHAEAPLRQVCQGWPFVIGDHRMPSCVRQGCKARNTLA